MQANSERVEQCPPVPEKALVDNGDSLECFEKRNRTSSTYGISKIMV
jgi:hypothetical protein